MDENPYQSPVDIIPDGPQPGLLGWLFQLRNWWAGMMVCFIIALVVSPADPYSIGFAFWLLALIYFLGVALRAWFLRRRALKELTERRRRDYASNPKSKI